MPKRTDIHKILILGSGPIVIGQGCEFDYSGVQACKALRNEKYEVVLVNSNPATIMTDPEMADHTYIEPITCESVANIIAIERPDAILSTMGGQTALNCALQLYATGILAKYNVELIGASKAAIDKAEDREQFRVAMQKLGLDMAKSIAVNTQAEADQALAQLGFPIVIRPSYTLGGSGGGIAYNHEQFNQICTLGFSLSLNHQLLIEESLLGWKEYELEVIRDANDSCIIVCTIENLDPMGIHTGDSITVAPAQTLTDVEYQIMRNAAIAILREIGVQTGGSNVQFAVHPQTGRMVVIEMNPRVSRSSALASKATGFPIAKVAALLAVGYTLDELQNDITGDIIPASFEPTLDYVVVKIPRFNFEKFPVIKPQLTTQMQSVGEVMAIGGCFAAALQKALCSLEIDLCGFNSQSTDLDSIIHELKHTGPLRLLYVADAMRLGLSLEEIHKHTSIDPWFLDQIQMLIGYETQIQNTAWQEITASQLLHWKQLGFSDSRLAILLNVAATELRKLRITLALTPKYKRIDSCAAEFPAATAYLYSTYEGKCEAAVSTRKKVIVLGSGPNRIGQGIEFDYCCVQAVQALRELGIEAIMINCNPETVSTDYDISDRLYFEALTLESVLDIVELEQPLGVILQLGGQTPLKLANDLQTYGVTVLGSSADIIHLAEDRGSFSQIINKLKLQQPQNALAETLDQGLAAAALLNYPLILRPSYVLGGRSMRIVYNDFELTEYLQCSFQVSKNTPVLIDSYLLHAIEIDVDLIADGSGGILITAIMQHIEPAGVHSGDSAVCLPPHTLSAALQQQIKAQAQALALELKIIGFMNIQFAVQNDNIYILEVNPRASRTVPFVSKSIGCAVTKIVVKCMLGISLAQQQLPQLSTPDVFAVKQSVFPFNKFLGSDPILGPEMRSTGEVMGFGSSFAAAFAKSLQAAGVPELTAPLSVYLCVANDDIKAALILARRLSSHGVEIYTSSITGSCLIAAGVDCYIIADSKAVTELIVARTINLVISTASASAAAELRALAIRHRVICVTTIAGAAAMLDSRLFETSTSASYRLQSLFLPQARYEVASALT